MVRSDSPPISVSLRDTKTGEANCTVVWVRGEHDLATRVSLAVAVARAAQLDDVPVVVDLSGVTFMDASTVGAIVGNRNRLRARRQSLELRAPSPPALRVLELCGLESLIQRHAGHSTGAAAALATWVDVVPVAAGGEIVDEADRVEARPETRPALVLAVVSHSEDATAAIGTDRAGP